MQPQLVNKFRTLAWICLFASLAGMLFQLIDEARLSYSSVLLGFPLGLAFGILELFVFPKADRWLGRWSFTGILLFKTLVYTAIIYIVVAVLTIIVGLAQGRRWSELPGFLQSLELLVLVVYTLTLYGLFIFILQINRLLGEGVLWKFIRGKYHQPREEERIFMFLDMNSSTTIAEQLGHVRFYTLLNELFHQISEPVLQTKAEIYQYVGDEVVLTWELEEGLEDSNCLKTYFIFREHLLRNSEYYFNKYGVKPAFKAGLHFGKVISAQIGDLKREIVYNGDVLNTAARIRSECNTYERDCLVSGNLLNQLKPLTDFRWELVNTVTLRGKESEVELFSVTSKS